MTYWHTHSSEKGQKHHIYQIFHYFPDYVLLVKKQTAYVSYLIDLHWTHSDKRTIYIIKNILR